MNRVEFVHLIENKPETIDQIQHNFVKFMALYNLISEYTFSAIDMNDCSFCITFIESVDVQKIYDFLPNEMYMYNTLLRFEKQKSANSIIIKFI